MLLDKIQKEINRYKIAREMTEKATAWKDYISIGNSHDSSNEREFNVSFLKLAQERFLEVNKDTIKQIALNLIDNELDCFESWKNSN